ncbi:MAG: hypothetical protein ACRDIF_03380 [Actinomycetota bacterium]
MDHGTHLDLDPVNDSLAGESLSMHERLVVSPCSGRLRRDPEESYASEGEYVLEGQVVAEVVGPSGELVSVRSPFAGWAMGYLLVDRSPVRSSEPVLWLRCS